MSSQLTSKSVPKLIELIKPIKQRCGGTRKVRMMEQLCQEQKLISIATGTITRNVSIIGGERSYVLLGSLARLERALTRWTMDELVSKHQFIPVVVPNIIHDRIIERCGFPTKSTRSQVYKISATTSDSREYNDNDEPQNKVEATNDNKTQSCLAGTSEFALASIHIGDTIPHTELPKKYCALSRCYRAETSNTASEPGIYRVHYFNKVEMVALTMPDQSASMHEEFLNIQKSLYQDLDLHFQILDMPEDDLGLSAKKKYDIEAWMEGRQRFGEISSTSNCEAYQSSRLNIQYSEMIERDDQLQLDKGYVHTVNGTACSTIRTLIALIEQHQNEEGKVDIPEPLVPYMGGTTQIPDANDERLLADVELTYSSDD